MTIANEDARSGPYNGNGATTVFAYDFKVTDEAHLVVTQTSAAGVDTVKALTTDYTVSGVGSDLGGNITLLVAPATGEKLTVTRNVTKTQQVDLQNRGSFLPSTIESALDKLTQITQDLSEQLGRAVKQPVTSVIELIFPAPTGNGDKVIGFNAAGTQLEAKTVNAAAYITTPGSATDNAVVRFDGTTGTGFQNSPVTIDDAGAVGGVASINGTAAADFLTSDDLGDTVQEFDEATLKADEDETVTARIKPAIQSVSSAAGAITLDFSTGGTTKRTTLTENITSITISGLTDGMTAEWWVTQAAASSYTITGFPTITWSNDGAEPVMPATNSALLIYQFRLDNTVTVGSAG